MTANPNSMSRVDIASSPRDLQTHHIQNRNFAVMLVLLIFAVANISIDSVLLSRAPVSPTVYVRNNEYEPGLSYDGCYGKMVYTSCENATFFRINNNTYIIEENKHRLGGCRYPYENRSVTSCPSEGRRLAEGGTTSYYVDTVDYTDETLLFNVDGENTDMINSLSDAWDNDNPNMAICNDRQTDANGFIINDPEADTCESECMDVFWGRGINWDTGHKPANELYNVLFKNVLKVIRRWNPVREWNQGFPSDDTDFIQAVDRILLTKIATRDRFGTEIEHPFSRRTNSWPYRETLAQNIRPFVQCYLNNTATGMPGIHSMNPREFCFTHYSHRGQWLPGYAGGSAVYSHQTYLNYYQFSRPFCRRMCRETLHDPDEPADWDRPGGILGTGNIALDLMRKMVFINFEHFIKQDLFRNNGIKGAGHINPHCYKNIETSFTNSNTMESCLWDMHNIVQFILKRHAKSQGRNEWDWQIRARCREMITRANP